MSGAQSSGTSHTSHHQSASGWGQASSQRPSGWGQSCKESAGTDGPLGSRVQSDKIYVYLCHSMFMLYHSHFGKVHQPGLGEVGGALLDVGEV